MEELDIINKITKEEIQIFNKEVRPHGSSGAIYLPKKLVGKKVIVLLKQNEN